MAVTDSINLERRGTEPNRQFSRFNLVACQAIKTIERVLESSAGTNLLLSMNDLALERMTASTARCVCRILLAGLLAISADCIAAGDFIDHRLAKDTGGLYSIALENAVPVSLAIAASGCALWRGGEDVLGRTCFESGESIAISSLSALALQYATGRKSPAQSADPGHWFTGSKGSFPSLHVSATTAAVTPLILQYVHDDPWVSTLALFPVYETVARVKSQNHWQTDVLAGALLGAGVGYAEFKLNSPLVLRLLPGGAYVGFSGRF